MKVGGGGGWGKHPINILLISKFLSWRHINTNAAHVHLFLKISLWEKFKILWSWGPSCLWFFYLGSWPISHVWVHFWAEYLCSAPQNKICWVQKTLTKIKTFKYLEKWKKTSYCCSEKVSEKCQHCLHNSRFSAFMEIVSPNYAVCYYFLFPSLCYGKQL